MSFVARSREPEHLEGWGGVVVGREAEEGRADLSSTCSSLAGANRAICCRSERRGPCVSFLAFIGIVYSGVSASSSMVSRRRSAEFSSCRALSGAGVPASYLI